MIERNMSYRRRTALGTMVTARSLLEMHDPNAALYWAFVAGMQITGRDYAEAKGEAAALGIVPPCLLAPSGAPAANTPAVEEREASEERRAALRALDVARGLLAIQDSQAALFWAFIAGQRATGRSYTKAKQEAAALGLVPPWLPIDAPVRPLPSRERGTGYAQVSLASAREMFAARYLDATLYWAFVAGQLAAGEGYAEAKREAAAFGLAPAHEQL